MTEAAVVDTREGECSKTDCPANEGGACLENHADRIDCEFFELTASEEDAPSEAQRPRVGLPDGEALRPDDAERVLRSHPTSLVVPLGRVGAGKTTLIAVAYHLLRSRRLDNWRFSGSETVIGLARRAHYASFASRGLSPRTPRTEKEESGLLLHLGMRGVSDGGRYPVLISDISGEHVRQVANGQSIDVVERAVAKCDHLPIVVDGKKLAEPKTRALTVHDARTLIKMVEKLERPDRSSVSLVVTKADLLVGLDMTEALDAIVRGTIVEGAPQFVTADRASSSTDSEGEPIVSLGAGVPEFIEHIAARNAASQADTPKTVQPHPSEIVRRYWVKP